MRRSPSSWWIKRDAESADATATVTVTAVGDAPQQLKPEPGESPSAALVSVSTTEDTAVSFTAAAFEAVFSDPDENDSLKAVQVASLPDTGHGVLSVGADAVSADQKVVHADLGTLTFTPAANWHGEASFTFKLLDQSDKASEAAKATITVTAVNDAPTAGGTEPEHRGRHRPDVHWQATSRGRSAIRIPATA